jgi:adenine/guanine phosphoribosyltransferase-like PRPP-binding protein
MEGVDYVVGFPEGGALPAFAFAQITERPLVLSTRLRLSLSPVISFEEPHTSIGVTHHLHGLREGDRVVIIEDEVTSGRTLVNAVRALRGAGVQVDDVGVLLVVDHPALWKLMTDEKVSLHAQARLPAEYAELMRSTL